MARGQRRSRPRLGRWTAGLATLLLTLALSLGLPYGPPARSQSAAPAPSSRVREEIRAVWFTANDMDVLRDRARMKEAVRQLAALKFNTLYPVVWNSGFAYYPSAVSERHGLQDFQYRGLQGQDILQELIEEAHGQGLLVLPWFEFGFMVPPGSVLTRRQPDWLSRRRDGTLTSVSAAGQVSWLNPLHPRVQALLSELILEIATTYDADGIQFDDHTSLPNDFGYDTFTSSLYKRSTGREPPANPSDGAWVKWRADRISAFIQQLATQLRQKRPGFLVSLSPNYHDFAYKLQLQDWLTWVRQGSVDEVVVQLYRPDLASFETDLNRPEFAASSQRIPTAVGILTGQRTQPVPIARVVAQAQAARRRGLGSAYFYYETLWEHGNEDPDLRRAALASLYREPAPRRPVAVRPAAGQSASPIQERRPASPAERTAPAPPSPISPPAPARPQATPPRPIPPPLPPLPAPARPAAAPASATPLPSAIRPAPDGTSPTGSGGVAGSPAPPSPLPQQPAVDPSWGPWNGAAEDIVIPPGADPVQPTR